MNEADRFGRSDASMLINRWGLAENLVEKRLQSKNEKSATRFVALHIMP